jgi:hypothetical protein
VSPVSSLPLLSSLSSLSSLSLSFSLSYQSRVCREDDIVLSEFLAPLHLPNAVIRVYGPRALFRLAEKFVSPFYRKGKEVSLCLPSSI